MDTKTIGKYAFIIGIVLALLGGFIDALGDINALLLPLLGIAVGALYIDRDDATGYYIFTMAVLAFAGGLGELFGAGEYVAGWLSATMPMLTAGAVTLIILEFYKRVTS